MGLRALSGRAGRAADSRGLDRVAKRRDIPGDDFGEAVDEADKLSNIVLATSRQYQGSRVRPDLLNRPHGDDPRHEGSYRLAEPDRISTVAGIRTLTATTRGVVRKNTRFYPVTADPSALRQHGVIGTNRYYMANMHRVCKAQCPMAGTPSHHPFCRILVTALFAVVLPGSSSRAAPRDRTGALVSPSSHSASSAKDNQVESMLRDVVGDDFRIRPTRHFLIASDTNEGALEPLLGRLEGTYHAVWQYCHESGLATSEPDHRLGVICFDRLEDFTSAAEKLGVAGGSVGFYYQPKNISIFTNALRLPEVVALTEHIDRLHNQWMQPSRVPRNIPSAARRRRELRSQLSRLRLQREALVKRVNQLVIQHEAAHQLLFDLEVHAPRGGNPQWLVEGLACQFEIPQPDPQGRLRAINHVRLADFRDALGLDVGAHVVDRDAIEKAVEKGRWTPIADLVSDRNVFGGHSVNEAFLYAQAWALVYYLNTTRRDSFLEYVVRVRDRSGNGPIRPEVRAEEFGQAFGVVDDAWETQWVQHMAGLRWSPRKAGRD